MNLNIVFENQHFVIFDKASGVLSVPSRDLADKRGILGIEAEKQMGIQLYPTHRLDFEVSGLILFAKNPKAHVVANDGFEKRLISKSYSAISEGPQFNHFPENVKVDRTCIDLRLNEEMTWKAKILKGKRRTFESPSGKNSVTVANVIEIKNNRQLWVLNPLTGRSHQLRWELSRHGYPILGDRLYGSQISLENHQICLRSIRLNFEKSQLLLDLGLPALVKIDGFSLNGSI